MATVTGSGQKKLQTNDGKVELNLNANNLKTRDDNNTRFITGKTESGQTVHNLSQEGKDVAGAEDQETIFNIDNNLFKIVDTDTITIAGGTVAASDITTFSSGNISHNLGYTPAFIVYTTGGGGSFSLFGGDSIGAWSDAGTTIAIEYFVRENVTVTSTYIRFSISVNNARNYSFTYGGPDIKYYLLQETAS